MNYDTKISKKKQGFFNRILVEKNRVFLGAILRHTKCVKKWKRGLND